MQFGFFYLRDVLLLYKFYTKGYSPLDRYWHLIVRYGVYDALSIQQAFCECTIIAQACYV